MPQNAADAISVTKPGSKVSQFRLYREANRLIPLHLTTKAAFVHKAVAEAAVNPTLIALALLGRVTRPTQGANEIERISISTNMEFEANVGAIAQILRLSNEDVVRLAVEAKVFPAVGFEAANEQPVTIDAGVQAMRAMAQVAVNSGRSAVAA